MNKIIRKGLLPLRLLPLALLFCACSGPKGKIYTEGKQWKYSCVFYAPNGQVEDSFLIDLKVQANAIALLAGQIPIIYEYTSGGEKIQETTGVIEEEEMVSIHQPRMGKLSFTQILPMPTVGYPLGNKSESTIETKIEKSPFTELNGKIVKQTRRTLAPDSVSYKGTFIKCFTYEAENASLVQELGQYHLKYWFNAEKGFVRYLYTKPDGGTVVINLIEVTDK